MGSFSYTVKKYFAFSEEEIKALALSILGLAFIVSYNKWGAETFDFWVGLRNFFYALLFVTLSLLVHQSAQRVAGFSVGLKVEYKIWVYGLVIGLALCVVSLGKLWFLAPGGIIMYHMAGHRIGSFRYGLNFWPMGLVALSGSLATLVLAMILKILLLIAPENALLHQALFFNLVFAVITMLPVPPLNGSHLFFASRLMYVFSTALIVGLAVALYFLGVFLSVLLGFIFGAIIFLMYIFQDFGGGSHGH